MKHVPRFYISPQSVAEINRFAQQHYAFLRALREARQVRERRAGRIVIRDFTVIEGGRHESA